MILFLAIEEDLFLAALFQIFARRNKEAGSAAGRVADHVVGFGVHQLHHHADDVARRAELAVETGLADLAEQVFVSIAAHVRRLRSAHQTVNFISSHTLRLQMYFIGRALMLVQLIACNFKRII